MAMGNADPTANLAIQQLAAQVKALEQKLKDAKAKDEEYLTLKDAERICKKVKAQGERLNNVEAEQAKVGTDVKKLSDQTAKLSDRLRQVQDAQGDSTPKPKPNPPAARANMAKGKASGKRANSPDSSPVVRRSSVNTPPAKKVRRSFLDEL